MQASAACLAASQAAGMRVHAQRAGSSSSSRRAAGRLAVRATASPPEGGLGASGLNTTVSLGPKAPSSSGSPSLGPKLGASTSKPQLSIDDVPLKSGVEVDYAKLRDLLKEGKWREAEDETRELLIAAAGPAAVKRGWVYFSEIKFIPVDDMQTLDGLWKAASGGRYGYAVQREIWLQNRRQWPKFFKAIDWVVGENNVYRKWPAEFDYSDKAPKGHLPLTNALRGTRLFEAIMEHPAFEKDLKSSAANGAAQPGWLNK